MFHLAEIIARGSRPPWQRPRSLFWPILLLALHIGCLGSAEAWSDGALPRGWAHWHRSDAEFHRLQTPLLHLPSADPVSYLEQHGHMLGHTARSVMHVGPEEWEERDVASEGLWHYLADGTCLWRLSIVSQGAASQILIFSELGMPWGGEMSIFSPKATGNRTECTHSCIRIQAARLQSRKLTTLAMQGEMVTLEYHHPEVFPPAKGFIVRIAGILQGLPDILPRAAADVARRRHQRRALLEKTVQVGYTPGTGFNLSEMQQREDPISPCTSSVLCDPAYSRIKDAVVDIYAVNVKLKAMGLCTGTLIPGPLNRKYIITADHCFVNKKAIDSFEYWLLIFRYEVPCGQTDVKPVQEVVQGVKLLFYDSKADILLLDISATIPDRFNPYLLGFDGSTTTVPKRAVGIHHPHGNFKHISYANTSGSISTSFVATRFPEGALQPTNATHFQVKWSKGVTAPGSSGSPLIDAETGKVVGVLTGGLSDCHATGSPDYYGRLSAAWTNGLDHFLSSAPSQGVLEEVADILESTSNGGKIIVRTMESSSVEDHGPALGIFPHVITFTPDHQSDAFTYYLTDPINRTDEIISMSIDVRGTVPGNRFDVTPYVSLSADNDSFTSNDTFSYRRSITINITGLDEVEMIPGNLLRFQLIFTLTSSVDPNYLHIHTMKGILRSSAEPWSQFRATALACDELPCYKYWPVRASNDTDPTDDAFSDTVVVVQDPRLAIFSYTPEKRVDAQLDVCFEPGILIGATVSIYIDQMFTWTLSHDPFGDPNCIHIASTVIQTNETYTVVVSDADSFDAVLPMRIVKYIYIGDTQVEVVDPATLAGRVEGGALASPAVTKASVIALPPHAELAIPQGGSRPHYGAA